MDQKRYFCIPNQIPNFELPAPTENTIFDWLNLGMQRADCRVKTYTRIFDSWGEGVGAPTSLFKGQLRLPF